MTVRRLYIDRAPLRLACKDTPLQIGNEAAKHQEDGHDQVGTAHRLLIEGLNRLLAADRSIEENFMQADYFAEYRHLNLSRDDKGVLKRSVCRRRVALQCRVVSIALDDRNKESAHGRESPMAPDIEP